MRKRKYLMRLSNNNLATAYKVRSIQDYDKLADTHNFYLAARDQSTSEPKLLPIKRLANRDEAIDVAIALTRELVQQLDDTDGVYYLNQFDVDEINLNGEVFGDIAKRYALPGYYRGSRLLVSTARVEAGLWQRRGIGVVAVPREDK